MAVHSSKEEKSMKNILRCGAFLASLATACGPVDEDSRAPEASEALGASHAALEEDNGLAFNGLAFNGLAFNGLAFNGLAFNGLASKEFNSWFKQHPTESDQFMKYLVRCAVPDGQSRWFWDGQRVYSWSGGLGLAPDWASGKSASVEEQQTVSACLAALTNKYGTPVLVSLLGTTAKGQAIPVSTDERSTYTLHEGCFFGNLFSDEGLFVGNDQGLLSPAQSSLRACALTSGNPCPPLKQVGSCHAVCQMDSTGSFFTRCTYKGVSYHALTTHLRPQDIYTCGDGVCQATESCGDGQTALSCKADCGKCQPPQPPRP
jgi:hypothetical protein